MAFYFVQFLTGLASAASLFLVASGLSIIFGVTRIVNFAHGAFYMLGAYVAFTLTERFSGAPVFEDKQGGPAIVGVVSWSTGPNGSAGCGGMTGVTPLTLYRDWIVQTAQKWGAGL